MYTLVKEKYMYRGECGAYDGRASTYIIFVEDGYPDMP